MRPKSEVYISFGIVILTCLTSGTLTYYTFESKRKRQTTVAIVADAVIIAGTIMFAIAAYKMHKLRESASLISGTTATPMIPG